jgi:hypothetical protein
MIFLKVYKEFEEEIAIQTNTQEIVAIARHFIFSTIEKVIEKEVKRKVKLPGKRETVKGFSKFNVAFKLLRYFIFCLSDQSQA